jgi:hypothetical protein
LDVLLDEHHLAAERDDVEHRNHVAVMHLGRDPRLVEEHGDELLVLGELRVHALGGDDAREADIAHQPSNVDRRHATACNLAMQQVAADRERLVLLRHSKKLMEPPALQK